MIGGIDPFVEKAYAADSIDALRQLCIDFFLAQGLKMVSYHHLPPPGASDYNSNITVAAYGYPEDWAKIYVERKYYEIDPVPKRAIDAAFPFWWSEIGKDKNLTEEERDYLDAVTKADLGEGLAIPVFGPHGRNGYAGLGFGKKGVELSVAEIAMLQWACQLAHQRYVHLLRARAPADITLSKRETEILEWVARGKSNPVIAEIIGISTYTVDTYLRRIYGKLDVSDRVTAALRGLAIGLVA